MRYWLCGQKQIWKHRNLGLASSKREASGVLPRQNVSSLLHERGQREPQTVVDGEVIGDRVDPMRPFLDSPLVGAEPRDEEDDDGNADVSEDDVHPDFSAKRLHEGED